jgi:hypothetical protein
LSADGRCVVFLSIATNLVSGDTNAYGDVFVRDLVAGTTERVNLTPSGGQSLGGVQLGTQSISGNGRYATFVSNAPDLMPAGAPRTDPLNPNSSFCYQAFRFDRVAHTTEIVSRGPSGDLADQGIGVGTIGSSADGRYLAFASRSTNLVSGMPSNVAGVFVRDCATGLVAFASPGLGGSWPDAGVFSWQVLLDAAGTSVVFASPSTNLVAGDSNGFMDVFVAR